jgi:hypothetical protein
MAAKISLNEVVNALEMSSDELSSFVNRQTGQVLTLTNETLRMAEEETTQELSDWQEQELQNSREVLDSEDWLDLPSKFEVHEWELMNRFGQSLSIPAQRDEILDAIHGSGAFRNFKGAIRRLRLEESWFAFKGSALEEMARSWLGEHGLDIDDSDRRPR